MGAGIAPEAGQRRRPLRIALGLAALVGAVVAAVAWGLRSRGDRPADDAAQLQALYSAWNEFHAGRLDRATALLDRRAAAVTPTALDRLLRAEIAEAQDRPDAALEALAAVPDDDPIGPQARLREGQILLVEGRARPAEAAYLRAQRLDPGLLQTYRELVYLYANQRRQAEADAQFHALARRAPLDHVLAFAWCQGACDIWDPNAAGQVLARFVAADPKDRPSRLALAESFRRNSEFDRAEETLLPLSSADPDALALRAQMAIDRGDPEQATSLAAGGPADHPRLNVLRGQLALHRRDAGAAVALFRAAAEAAPDDRDALHGLGRALELTGTPGAGPPLEKAARIDELRRAIQDSVSTLKTDSKLFFKLGALCESIGWPGPARAWYALAVARDPLDRPAQEALSRLGGDPAPG